MRITGSILIFFALIIGFFLLISKSPVLTAIGIILVLGGLFAPFYTDQLQKIFGRTSDNLIQSEPVAAVGDEVVSGENRLKNDKGYSRSEINVATNQDEAPKALPAASDLSGRDLTGVVLRNIMLSRANLSKVKLSDSDLSNANLSRADLSEAQLPRANLVNADLSRADMRGINLHAAKLMHTNLSVADLTGANLSHADLTGANLSGATLFNVNFKGAVLSNCRIYGVSIQSIQLEGARQFNLIITPDQPNQPTISADSIEMAQFINLLLNNPKIREVINTTAKKVVLILGYFTLERRAHLNALRNSLRSNDFIPLVCDFDKPTHSDLTQTISTLAHLARFIIADSTNSTKVLQVLQAIIPSIPTTPIQLLHQGNANYAVFENLTKNIGVLPVFQYENETNLDETSLKQNIIDPAEEKAKELGQAVA